MLVEDLTWKEVEGSPVLDGLFENGAAANLSTAQGGPPPDPLTGYAFIGAGARTDTRVLPEKLPDDPAAIPGAFTGPASTVRPGSLGQALREEGLVAAAIGERARLAAMDRKGRVPLYYDGERPVGDLRRALEEGADLVAVSTRSVEEAAELVSAARGATVALASPGPRSLTPFALGGEEGLLYSPTTRTTGLISNADVAPTLLAALGVDPPAGMQGRVASVRPGEPEAARRLGERILFVARSRFEVWLMVGLAAGLAVAALPLIRALRWRMDPGSGVLVLAALPAGALLAAAVPVTNTPAVAALTLLFAAALTVISSLVSKTGSDTLAGVCLGTATLVLADAAFGGPLMRLSTLGYNPGYGARFYGAGNEYAAVLAGSLTMGLGALAAARRPPARTLVAAGAAAVFVLGLPTMGADVGGSLALGLGYGATVALVRGDRPPGVAAWAAGGFALAATLFLASGFLLPDTSHGSRAAGGEGDLYEMTIRKLLISLSYLGNPLLLALLLASSALVYAGWRRTRSTPLAAGILGASLTAAASGALNDSGLVATLFALLYPAAASTLALLPKSTPRPDRPPL
ncbi:MAG: hypothetical protein AB1425_01180 [Actinomycetota bacterium]